MRIKKEWFMQLKRFATAINFILFQVAWLACVWGAANSFGWLGPVTVAILVPLQVCLLTENRKQETVFVFICGSIGFLLETILITGDVYASQGVMVLFVCPPWMAALWFNFAMLVSISLSWLKRKYLLAAILGGLAGPLAYWGGEKLGAIKIADAFLLGYLPLIALWFLVLPFLIYVHGRVTEP